MIPGFLIPFRLIGLKLSAFASALLPQLLLTGGMALVCWTWLRLLNGVSVVNPWVQLLSTSVLGAVVYICSFVLLWPAVMQHLEDVLGTSSLGTKFAACLMSSRQFCLRGISR